MFGNRWYERAAFGLTGNRDIHRAVHLTSVVAQAQRAEPRARVGRDRLVDRHVALAERQPVARVPVPGALGPVSRHGHRHGGTVRVSQPAVVDLGGHVALHPERIALGHHGGLGRGHGQRRYTFTGREENTTLRTTPTASCARSVFTFRVVGRRRDGDEAAVHVAV